MKIITVEELERNLDFYLDMASCENILVTIDGRIIARITSPEDNLDTFK